MQGTLLSPLSLWKGYDAEELDLQINVSTTYSEKNYQVKQLFITGLKESEEQIRVAIKLYYPLQEEKCPVVLYVGGFEKHRTDSFFNELIQNGYAVALFDYLGTGIDEEQLTAFDKNFSYAKYPNCLPILEVASPTVEASPWYVWSRLTRRVITYLQSDVKLNDKIMVVGEGEGAVIMWHVVAMDPRVTCGCSLGGYFPKSISDIERHSALTPDNERWVAGLLSESYAQFTKCPILSLLATNSREASFSRLQHIFHNIPDATKAYYAFTPISEGEFSLQSKETVMAFARCFLNGDGNMQRCPELQISDATGVKHCNVKVSGKPTSVTLYYSYGNEEPCYKNWTAQKTMPTEPGGTVYCADIRTDNLQGNMQIFANVYYEGLVLSTQMLSYTLPATDSTRLQKRILYEGRGGTEGFFSVTGDLFLDKDVCVMKKGAMNISGITTTKGCLLSFRINDSLYQPSEDSLIRFDAYSEVKKTIKIVMYRQENDALVEYSATCLIMPHATWDKINLSQDDFKTADYIPLTSWKNIKKMTIVGAENVLFNNMLWV